MRARTVETVEPHRQRPSPETLAWVARSVSPTAGVVGWRRLTGGSPQASVHRVTVVNGEDRHHLVLRRWMPGDEEWTAWTRSAVRAEASVLEALAETDVPAPRLVAITEGPEANAGPAVLMTRAPGRIQLQPRRPSEWVSGMAVMLARIHHVPIVAPAWEPWIDVETLSVPPWSQRPDVWEVAIDAARRAVGGDRCFIHRDYQHFNILWRRDHITAVVDWVHASTGPPGIDVGHCRLNLALLFSAELAEQFRCAYEAEAGLRVDPQWDITSLLSFNETWHSGLPRQVDGRTTVDRAGMNGRFEDLLTAAVARL